MPKSFRGSFLYFNKSFIFSDYNICYYIYILKKIVKMETKAIKIRLKYNMIHINTLSQVISTVSMGQAYESIWKSGLDG